MEWLNDLPTLLRWAVYGVAFMALLGMAFYVVMWFVVAIGTIILAIGDDRRARRRAKQRKAFRARTTPRRP